MMMKNLKKQDGYILAYALVVIMVISLVAVAACTTAARNHKNQIAALQYTEDKYAAEGAIELFVAELQAGAVEYVTGLAGNAVLPSEFSGKINEKIDLAEQAQRQFYEGQDFSFELTDNNAEDESTGYIARFEENINQELETVTFAIDEPKEENNKIAGNVYYLINATAEFGSVQVSADIRLSFAAEQYKEDNGGQKIDYAKIYGVAFEYISYEVTTVQVENQEVGS
ncbi:MAG: hypothetical protein IKV79_05215 [Oscillospiraceae bacterium]|nr:hypothetical protein [Oscillospiraceae bacterium]